MSMGVNEKGGIFGQITRFYDKFNKSVQNIDKTVDDLKKTGESVTNEVSSFVKDSLSTDTNLKPQKKENDSLFFKIFKDDSTDANK